ncbi:hypothetical protein WIW50_02645 [Flavobacteriaceae bacterium 3-367]
MKELSFNTGILDAVLSIVVVALDIVLALVVVGSLLALVGLM